MCCLYLMQFQKPPFTWPMAPPQNAVFSKSVHRDTFFIFLINFICIHNDLAKISKRNYRRVLSYQGFSSVQKNHIFMFLQKTVWGIGKVCMAFCKGQWGIYPRPIKVVKLYLSSEIQRGSFLLNKKIRKFQVPHSRPWGYPGVPHWVYILYGGRWLLQGM